MEVGSKVAVLDGGYVGIVYMNDRCGEGDYPWHIILQNEWGVRSGCYNSKDLKVLGWVGPLCGHSTFEHPLTSLLEYLDSSEHLKQHMLRVFKEKCAGLG